MIAWSNDTKEHEASVDNNFHNGSDNGRAATPSDSCLTATVDIKAILNASLRTRYQYASYIIWRPWICKVLHSVEEPTRLEIDSCKNALEVSSRRLSPPLAHSYSTRRLVRFGHSHQLPSNLTDDSYHIYMSIPTGLYLSLVELSPVQRLTLSSLFGILLLFKACALNQSLGRILRSELTDGAIGNSIYFYLAWIRDMKVLHPLARWCWQFLQLVYNDHELVADLHRGVQHNF